jgi:hypothetical protein
MAEFQGLPIRPADCIDSDFCPFVEEEEYSTLLHVHRHGLGVERLSNLPDAGSLSKTTKDEKAGTI